MKTTRVFVAVCLLIVIAAVTGCSEKTAGVQRAEKATASMQTVESDIRKTVAQIDATNASLLHVINSKDSPNIKEAFDSYSAEVNKMDKSGKVLLAHTDQMTARGNDYFQEWQKSGNTYTNPDIQKLSQERRVELEKTFNRISEASPGVKGYLNAYLSNLKQIRTYLSNDLTPQGVDSISQIAQSTIADGDNVKIGTEPMLTATAQARSEMSAAGAAAGGKQGTQSSPNTY